MRLEGLYYSESSRKTKSVQLRRYDRFCLDDGVLSYPLDSGIMRRYVAHLSKDLCYSSIQQYVSAVLVYSKMLGYAPETRETLGLVWILGGVKRYKGNFVESSSCLFPQDLLLIKTFLIMSVMEDLVFWVACLIMFRTLLRGSNVLYSDMCLMYGDVKLCDWGVIFNVSKTKTIQYKQRSLEIPVAEV